MAQDLTADPERPALGETRRSAIAALLREKGAVTVADLEQRFAISPMTARRDLSELERQGIARRTHGGAVLPSIAAHEDSFARRVEVATDAKLALAEAAIQMLSPRETVFLDSSTSAYFVARRIVEEGLGVTVITNSVPIMDLLAGTEKPNIELVGVGGSLRKLTSSFVGPFAVQTILGHYADRTFFSVKGITGDGVLTDADQLEAEVKRTMLSHAESAVLLVDGTKLSARGVSVVGRVADLSCVLAHGVAGTHRESLQADGVDLQIVEA